MEKPRRRWFRFDLPSMFAFLIGAAVGFGVSKFLEGRSAAWPALALCGPAGIPAVVLLRLTDNKEMAIRSIVLGLPFLYGAYAWVLARRPRLSTTFCIVALHALGTLATRLLLPSP